MQNQFKEFRKYLSCILAFVVVAVICWSAYRPAEWRVWWIEMCWVLAVFGLLVATYHKFQFSPMAYVLVSIWLIMHTIGAHYTFEHVPFSFITDLFGFERSHYDRIAHFAVGLNSFMIAELVFRKRWVTNVIFAAVFGTIAIMAMACAWEIIEWAVAVWDGGADGLAFLGSQGDIWDAQKDMLADTLGAIFAAVLFTNNSRRTNYYDQNADTVA